MKLLILFIILMLLISGASMAGGPTFGYGSDWKERCSSDLESNARHNGACSNFIWGYVLGVMRNVNSEGLNLDECGSSISDKNITQSFINYLDENPEMLKKEILAVLPQFLGLDKCGL